MVANGVLYMTDESSRLSAFASPATAIKVAVIEFYNASFDHYFVSKRSEIGLVRVKPRDPLHARLVQPRADRRVREEPRVVKVRRWRRRGVQSPS